MNHQELETDPTLCSQFEAAIQSLLDGDARSLPPALDLHRSACAHCRIKLRAAVELLNALPHLQRPAVPTKLTDRIVRAVLDEATPIRNPRFMRVRSLWWLAAAACLLLLIGLAQPWSNRGPLASLLAGRSHPPSTPSRSDQPVAPQIAADSANSVPLRERWETASSALESLTKRTAEPTRKLLPSQVESPSLNVPERYPLAIDSAAQSLQEVRQGAATSLEPMANSARRAFSMLLREASMNSENKNDF